MQSNRKKPIRVGFSRIAKVIHLATKTLLEYIVSKICLIRNPLLNYLKMGNKSNIVLIAQTRNGKSGNKKSVETNPTDYLTAC